MMVLSDPTVEVMGITCVSGNVPVAQVVRNVRRILSVCDRKDVPVFAGADHPLVRHEHDATYYHGKDGLGDAGVDPADEESEEAWPPVQQEHAILAMERICRENMVARRDGIHSSEEIGRMLLREGASFLAAANEIAAQGDYHAATIIRENSDRAIRRGKRLVDTYESTRAAADVHDLMPDVEILALGPLTNLALACRMFPHFSDCVKRLVVMGGTTYARGNVSSHPSAEFNAHHDPEAFHVVLDEFLITTLVTWECCVHHQLPWESTNAWLGMETKKARFLRRVSAHSRAYSERHGYGYIPCDPLAAAVALHPYAIVPHGGMALRHATVEIDGAATLGQVVWDWHEITRKIPNVLLVKEISVENLIPLYERMVADKMHTDP